MGPGVRRDDVPLLMMLMMPLADPELAVGLGDRNDHVLGATVVVRTL